MHWHHVRKSLGGESIELPCPISPEIGQALCAGAVSFQPFMRAARAGVCEASVWAANGFDRAPDSADFRHVDRSEVGRAALFDPPEAAANQSNPAPPSSNAAIYLRRRCHLPWRREEASKRRAPAWPSMAAGNYRERLGPRSCRALAHAAPPLKCESVVPSHLTLDPRRAFRRWTPQWTPRRLRKTNGLASGEANPSIFIGAAGRNRTHDPLVRSQVLYPAELQPPEPKSIAARSGQTRRAAAS